MVRVGLRRALAPFILLGGSMLVTIVAARYASRAVEAQDRLRFENSADAVRSAIAARLDAYTAMLRGGAGLFAASEEVTAAEFRAYVERLELPERYPGIQGIGFSRLVHAAERDRVAATLRRDLPSFHYWPPAGSGDLHAIVYLEPPDARNKVAIGYNMWSEPVRQSAMARARDTAEPAASGRVTLVQEIDPERQQAGFLIYVPVYRNGAVPRDLEDRRHLLLGFVYSPFRVSDLLSGILGSEPARAVTFEVYDGTRDPDRLMFRSATESPSGAFAVLRTMDVAGRPWTLVLHSAPDAAQSSGRVVVMLVAVGGTVLSIMLFVVMRTQVRARRTAERTADELRASEEALRRMNREKDDFLAVISHELRTPLNAIVGWAAMLRRGQVPPEGFQHALEVIERNAAAQATLVEDLLDISRAVAGRLRLDKDTVDVASALRASIDAIKPSADGRGIAIVADLAEDLGTIHADPARLEQVVLNLLSNAVKFTEHGGRVVLSARNGGSELVISIADTGIGIDPGFLPHVFDPFRQADTSTTRTNSGVGLGLAIARHLVELHGGSIEVASPGHGLGATFIVRLPRREGGGDHDFRSVTTFGLDKAPPRPDNRRSCRSPQPVPRSHLLVVQRHVDGHAARQRGGGAIRRHASGARSGPEGRDPRGDGADAVSSRQDRNGRALERERVLIGPAEAGRHAWQPWCPALAGLLCFRVRTVEGGGRGRCG